MQRPHIVFRGSALLSALVIVGGLVAYRSGAWRPSQLVPLAISTKTADDRSLIRADKNSRATVQVIGGSKSGIGLVIAASDTVHDNVITVNDIATTDSFTTSWRKSGMGSIIQRDSIEMTPVTAPTLDFNTLSTIDADFIVSPANLDQVDIEPPAVMGGSKSAPVFNMKSVPRPLPPPEHELWNAIRRRVFE